MCNAINAAAPDAQQLLRQLGVGPDALRQQLGTGEPRRFRLLQQLFDQFQQQSQGGINPQAIQNGQIPPQGLVSPPNMGGCGCGGYGRNVQKVDLGATPGQDPSSPQAIANRKNAGMIEQLLKANPQIKAQLEQALGGRILPDRLADGVLRVQRNPMGFGQPGPGGIPNAAATGTNLLNGLNQGALQAAGPQPGMDPFMGTMLGGLTNALGGGNLLPGGQAGGVPFGGAPFGAPIGAAPFGGAPIGAPIGGAPFGADPLASLFGGGAPIGGAPIGGAPIGGAPFGGAPFGGAPIGGAAGGGAPVGGALGGAGGMNDIGNVLGDPGMTMEDKVVMLLMKLTKQFDRQIEGQANKLQALQQQQGQGGQQGAGGKGGGGKGGGAGGQPSIDVESMNLKRLIDKRSQMFDMLRQVIDKYNQTAKGMIDGLGR